MDMYDIPFFNNGDNNSGSGGGTEELEELETLIDESGVLDSTEGTVNEKVEQLLKSTERYNFLKKESTGANFMNNNTIENIELDCINMNNLHYSFYNTPAIKTISLKNTQNIQDWTRAFHGCPAETIETLDFSSATTTSYFGTSHSLRNIKLEPNTLKVSTNFPSWGMTLESIQSIIDGLATVETQQKLTLHSSLVSKLTEDQLTTIANKNWTVG